MTQVITELVVRADGSLATLDRFEKGMAGAGKATDYTSGAVTSFEKRIIAARVAIERGNAVTTQSIERKTTEQRAWEKWSATVDKTTALRIRLERESAQAAVSAANAVNLGYTSQEQALTTLMALESRHAAQLSAHINAENNIAVAYSRTATAADQAAIATTRLDMANRNRSGGSNLNTANIAAQFQDVAVTSAMGMSPLMIALQQGTQLSAVLGGQGLTGVVKALGAAFASILSPVSLLTIGVVALVAWGIQAFAGIGKEADDATSSLDEHNASLDDLLDGYDKVRAAAQSAFDAAMKLPEGVVASDLRASLREQEEVQNAIQRRIEANRGALAETVEYFQQLQDIGTSTGGTGDVLDGAIQQIELIRQLGIDASSTKTELEAAATAAIELYNTADDPSIKAMADQAYQLAQELMAVRAQADSAAAALRAIPRDIQVRISMSQVFGDAMADIKDLYMDPRSRFDQAREQLTLRAQAAQESATSIAALTGLANDYDRVLASIDAAEAEANTKRGSASVKAAEKLIDAYKDLIAEGHNFIEEQHLEVQALGMTEEAANALRYAHDMMNKAEKAGVDVTAAKRAEIETLAGNMAAAEAETKRLTKAFEDQQQAVDDVLGTIGEAFSGLFDGTIKDFDGFIDHMIGGFAKLGQANLDKLFTSDGLGSIFNGSPNAANDNAGGSTNIFDAIFKGAKQGTEEGSETGLMGALKNGGLAGLAGAGLGGFGMGAQTQSPVMGALGGALSGFSAGGPVGAVIGGIAGFIGGLFGMNQALEEAKQKLNDNRAAIDQFISATLGETISQYAKILEDANAKAKEMIDLANAANDWDLAKKISDHLGQLPATLAREFQKDLQASINELSGEGWLNDVAAAQARYNDRLADAEKLGTDASLALTEFELSLQKIAKDGDLTTDQMAKLVAMFPQLAGAIETVVQAVDISGLQSNVDRARQSVISSYEKERSAIDALKNTWKQLSSQIRDFRNGLRLNDAVSPLSPYDKMAEAQKQFNDVSAKALAGDQQAMGDLTNVSQAYLDAARGYYGSSEKYFAIFGNVEGILDKALAKADAQVSVADQQLTLLDKQVSGLIDINNSVMDVAQAIRNLQEALGGLNQAGGFDAKTYWSDSVKGLYSEIGSFKDQTGASSVPIANFWNQLWGATSAAAMDDIARRLRGEVDALTPGYAMGTNFHPGGMAWVGEQGKERVFLPRGSQVMPHAQSMAFAANSNGAGIDELVTEVRALRTEVASLKAVSAAGAQATVAAVGGVSGEIQKGNQNAQLDRLQRKRAS